MWVMLAGPLIAGNNVRAMGEAKRAILINKEVIAVDQDALGIPGLLYKKERDVEIWFRPLAGNAWAMVVLDRGADVRSATFDWAQEHVEDAQNNLRLDFQKTVHQLRELFERAPAASTAKPLRITSAGSRRADVSDRKITDARRWSSRRSPLG